MFLLLIALLFFTSLSPAAVKKESSSPPLVFGPKASRTGALNLIITLAQIESDLEKNHTVKDPDIRMVRTVTDEISFKKGIVVGKSGLDIIKANISLLIGVLIALEKTTRLYFKNEGKYDEWYKQKVLQACLLSVVLLLALDSADLSKYSPLDLEHLQAVTQSYADVFQKKNNYKRQSELASKFCKRILAEVASRSAGSTIDDSD